MSKLKKTFLGLGLFTAMLLVLPPLIQPTSVKANNHESSVRIYGANVWGLRGYFAIHTWIAIKSKADPQYTNYQIIGWRIRRSGTALSVHTGDPDSPWFGNPAILLHEVSGAEAEALIPAIREAIHRYPFAQKYTMLPGPNSNSFTEWVAQEVPELGLNLPIKAIGRLWMRANYQELHSREFTASN